MYFCGLCCLKKRCDILFQKHLWCKKRQSQEVQITEWLKSVKSLWGTLHCIQTLSLQMYWMSYSFASTVKVCNFTDTHMQMQMCGTIATYIESVSIFSVLFSVMGVRWWNEKEPRTSDSDELLIDTYVWLLCLHSIFALIDVKIMSLLDFTAYIRCDVTSGN